METRAAARRWAESWCRSWEQGAVEAIVELYHPEAVYSSEPFRPPNLGHDGARRYVAGALASESEVRASFGEPIVDGDRAAVQWWASMVEDGAGITLAGISVLRFDADGLVVDEWDTWNQADGRRDPPPGWGR